MCSFTPSRFFVDGSVPARGREKDAIFENGLFGSKILSAKKN
jgi:hypothetical protein